MAAVWREMQAIKGVFLMFDMDFFLTMFAVFGVAPLLGVYIAYIHGSEQEATEKNKRLRESSIRILEGMLAGWPFATLAAMIAIRSVPQLGSFSHVYWAVAVFYLIFFLFFAWRLRRLLSK